MRIRFWGVRGSVPTPLTPSRLRSKISSIMQRVEPADLESQEARERFLASLPPYLFSCVGGNTSCVEVEIRDDLRIVFDAGTGIRELGLALAARKRPVDCRVFFSHFHWDHLQGLPFFAPAFDPSSRITYHSPIKGFRELVEAQMRSPWFPVTMDVMRAPREWMELSERPVAVGDATLSHRTMNHPGGCYSYMVERGGKKVIYSTDTELQRGDFLRNEANAAYFEDAEALIIDAQYTLDEALEKTDWGHSSFSLAADFASEWGIRRLVLFHHEPSYDDRKIETIFKSAEWYVERLATRGLEVILAREGLEIEV
ncbi:MAG: MBL fold metallo-hydrolase [Spirochaetales bacterium]|nr:MBL fold metallo-hydrolase [Spirochaetales bacterium]